MSDSGTPARVAWVKKKCPTCHGVIEIQESFLNEPIDCPLCGKSIVIQSTGTAIKEGAKTAGTLAGGCGCSIVGILLWLFMIGVIVIVAVMLVSFVLTKLGIMRISQ